MGTQRMVSQKPPFERRAFRAALLLGLHGRCPNCGRGPVFSSRFKVLDECPVCQLTYWPESGYYLGAMFLDFIISFLLITPIYVACLILIPGMVSLPAWKQVVIWVCAGSLLPIALLKWSYGIWLALDFWLNPWEAGKPPELLSR